MMADELLNARACAELLGLSVNRTLELLRARRLPAQRVGRDWLARRADVERFARTPRPRGVHLQSEPRAAQPAHATRSRRAGGVVRNVPVGSRDTVSTLEAAARLGVSRRRVLALIRAGSLTATQVGRNHLIRRADLERFAARPRPRGWQKGRARG